MATKPNLNSIVRRLDDGEDFSMTREQYINSTGADLPQSKSYTEKKSAVAKRAHERGFTVTVIPEVIMFHKV